MKAYKNNKGFTLAEMLIVIAIIGVLVAIVSTTISNSLEKAREAADLANIRSAISELSTYAMFDDRTNLPAYIVFDSEKKHYRTFVKATQKQTGWQSSNIEIDSSGYAVLNGATINAGNFSKGDRAYRIAININGKTGIILATITNRDSVKDDDMYYHTNEYVRKR